MKKIIWAVFFIMVFSLSAYAETAGTLTARTAYGTGAGYEASEDIGTGANGKIYKIFPMKDRSGQLTVAMIAGANTGTIYVTISLDSEIDADIAGGVRTNANWVEWENSTTTGSEIQTLNSNVKAIYAKSVSGAVTFEIDYE